MRPHRLNKNVHQNRHSKKKPLGIQIIIWFFIVSIFLWILGQGGAVVMYDTVASWGLQQSPHNIHPVILQLNQATACTDVIVSLPLFVCAIVGLSGNQFYGLVSSWMALGINLYWPVEAWTKQWYYARADIQNEPFALSLHLLLAFVVLFSAWASLYLYQNRRLFEY